jgi:hypothetical protein
MAKLSVGPILPSPTNPSLRIVIVYSGCYGEECNRAPSFIATEELAELAPHFHLIETEAGTSGACYAIDGTLPPESAFELYHQS